ncbi:endonuclease/exonuclease/phosphatase family protein [Promineifilum sp.]|uniref:endonuclease/exonuclease/phosphatase family protein n=1 Tax=Promineifilum sp. TaxID=2664178 RepID=UPI0035AF1BC6
MLRSFTLPLFLAALVSCVPAAIPSAGLEMLTMAEGSVGRSGLTRRFVRQFTNYAEPDGPLYTGEHVPAAPATPNELVVVSYNVQYGEAIDETIKAFRTIAPLPEAGIVLLQEMDAPGVERLARELGYNYVYYPSSVAHDGDDFGNAILARWPIVEPRKVILPGLHPLTGQQRTATRAVVQIGELEVLAYSAHLEIATAPPALRQEQVAALVADVPEDAGAVVVGGDFNIMTGRGVSALAARFADGELLHGSAGNGPTIKRYGLRVAAPDHVFARGFNVAGSGVLLGVSASDHYPVWVRLEKQ